MSDCTAKINFFGYYIICCIFIIMPVLAVEYILEGKIIFQKAKRNSEGRHDARKRSKFRKDL